MVRSDEQALVRERRKSRAIREIARAVGSTLDLDDLLRLIVGKIPDLMDAERSTLYLLDHDRGELWTKVLQAEELREIRLRVGEGIAGWVAMTGETVNIADAYQDPRFSPEIDRRSGYQTKSMLCVPLKNNQGQLIGVTQVLNKRDGGAFTAEDVDLLESIVSQASVAIENSKLYLSVVKKNAQLLEAQQLLRRRVRELDLLRQIERDIAGATEVAEVLDGLLKRTTALIGAEAGSILLLDAESDRLFFRSATGERSAALRSVTVAMGEGIAGWVAQNGEAVRVRNPSEDPRHNRELAERIGFQPRNILCVPLRGGNVHGAIELLSKVGKDAFDEDDQRLLTIIAARAAQAIELARIKEQQLRDRRLASIGQMLSGVLHDLKTPMTVISGYTQLMASSDDDATRQEYAELVMRQFDVLATMTKEVLAFARGESNILIRRVYINKFLDEMRTHLAHEFDGKSIELKIDARYRGTAQLDEGKFRRVFHNIARNAAEAMPNGGTFTIEVDLEGDQLVFLFSDSGQGIPAELEGRLFDAFATSGKVDGTGLGLAIVKKIIDEHGGTIDYRSTSSGTTFAIRLPMATTSSASNPRISTE
ncbi:MAG: GAF domain-containing protein [Deltaproteobacteria bacterium]|nr:GAF domain-containing protein [Deltaproteobacteria bacterium]